MLFTIELIYSNLNSTSLNRIRSIEINIIKNQNKR